LPSSNYGGNVGSLAKHDVIFIMHIAGGWSQIDRGVRNQLLQRVPQFCLGVRSEGYAGFMSRAFSQFAHKAKTLNIACVSNKIYKEIKPVCTKTMKVYICQNGVDTEIFKPSNHPQSRFIIGWAGNAITSYRPEKRVHLLRQLNYPLRIMSNWGKQFFKKNRSRDEMIDFYREIDAYVCTSYSEGMSQTILEAGASGLPIVSTSVGDVPEVIDDKWLVPIHPDSLVVSEMKNRLKELSNDYELRRKVGQQNLETVLRDWS